MCRELRQYRHPDMHTHALEQFRVQLGGCLGPHCSGDGGSSRRCSSYSHGSRDGKKSYMETVSRPAVVGRQVDLCVFCTNSTLQPDMGTGTAGTQAANFISKLALNKNVYMSIKIEHFREILELLKVLQSLILRSAARLQSK